MTLGTDQRKTLNAKNLTMSRRRHQVGREWLRGGPRRIPARSGSTSAREIGSSIEPARRRAVHGALFVQSVVQTVSLLRETGSGHRAPPREAASREAPWGKAYPCSCLTRRVRQVRADAPLDNRQRTNASCRGELGGPAGAVASTFAARSRSEFEGASSKTRHTLQDSREMGMASPERRCDHIFSHREKEFRPHPVCNPRVNRAWLV